VFYEKFIRMCVQKGVSPTAVAKAIGVNPSTVSDWSRGAKPRAHTLIRLAEYFGVDVIDQANSEVNYANCHLYGADENDPVGLHPNIRGHAALTKVIVETLYEKLPK
jgi:transcriptional regulator with XRE-family HTH domain